MIPDSVYLGHSYEAGCPLVGRDADGIEDPHRCGEQEWTVLKHRNAFFPCTG